MATAKAVTATTQGQEVKKMHNETINAVVATLEQAIDNLKALCVQEDPAESPTKPPPPKPLKLEEVRAILAEKSRIGHTDAIRELLENHGATKLSDIAPDKFPILLAEVEAL